MAKKASKTTAPQLNADTPKKKAAQQIKIVERPSDFPGVERLVFAEASSLSEHPDNWKTHTKRQTDSLDAEFQTVGWAGAFLYNLTTGRLLDGHGRNKTEEVKRRGIVPVLLGRWSPEQEDQILLHLDPIGGMFETQGPKFRALMERHKKGINETLDTIGGRHAEALGHINESLELHADSVDYGADPSFLPDYRLYGDEAVVTTGKEPGITDSVEIENSPKNIPGMYGLKLFSELPFDCFGQGGHYNIPSLRPEGLSGVPGVMQTWVGPETPYADSYFYIYGCAAIEKVRSSKMVVAYYTHDRKFESIWSDPRPFTARMINFQVHAVVTPNYSSWEMCAMWFDIHQTARSRWLGRYWQEAGLKVIPDVSLANLSDDTRFALRMTGLPVGLPCISVQVQQKGEADVEAFYALRKAMLLKVLQHLKPRQLLLYHGPDLPKNFTHGFPSETEVIEVKSWMWERGKVLKEKEYMK